jgi:ribosomal protein S18 acetylase RimI-like enzyme
VEIRHGQLPDLPYLYDICHRTGDEGQDASAVMGDRFLLGQVFAAPYLVRDPRWTWVACDGGIPVGYLLTTPDTRAFLEWEALHWKPGLRELYPLPVPAGLSPFETRLRERGHRPTGAPEFVDDYPAHFHIDLLPRAQGHKLGSRLIEAFVAQARSERIPGIHLGVGGRNTGAIAFYRKQGFSTIGEADWGFFLGMKL